MKKTFVGGAQWGSEGKGAIVGYLARKYPYTAVVAAFPPSTGHTFVSSENDRIMNMQLPIGCVGHHITEIFIGPGALVEVEIMAREIEECARHLKGKRILIHENAGVVLPEHSAAEKALGLTNIGSTTKGGMTAQVDRMRRDPDEMWVASNKLKGTPLERYVVDKFEYAASLAKHEDVLIEGSQGFSLSMYNGAYPYTTARDTSQYLVFSDCGLPWSWASEIETVWVARTWPIRVNNRTGSSGPCYSDQSEVSFDSIGQPVELTTVTKLPRRIFTFSYDQLRHLISQCGNNKTTLALMFCDYIHDYPTLHQMMTNIEDNGINVSMACFGPNERDIVDGTYADGKPKSYGDFCHEVKFALEHARGIK